MPNEGKKTVANAASDLDAMLVEMGFVEPPNVSLRWQGKVWSIKPITSIDPRLLAEMGKIQGVFDVLKTALGPKAYKTFPVPRGVDLPNGQTELEFFLDGWAALSDGASSGE